MKKLQIYILKDLFRALIPAFATLVLIMAAGFCMQLLRQGLDVVRLSGLLPPVFAYCVPMALPAAFLTAVIMTFGRLSSDNELMAIRAAGIHLFGVVYPVLAVAAALTLVAVYFQFETVPRARGAVRALRHEALKQVLLDKVALCARRRLAFPPTYVQYDDFKNGKMINLVVLEIRGDRPRTVITAESGVIKEDPEHAGFVSFEMSNCTVRWFGLEVGDQAVPMTSERVVLKVRVAPKAEEVLSQKKHLGFWELMHELRRLRETVASHPAIRDADRVREKGFTEIHGYDIEILEVDRVLGSLRQRHDKHAFQEPRRQEQVIERNRQLIADAEKDIELLQQQQAACLQELKQARETDTDNIEKQVELERRHRDLLAQVDALKKRIETLQAELGTAGSLADASSARARELDESIRELKVRKFELMDKRGKIQQVIEWAGEQEELLSLRLRVHKRLVQAVAVLVFAFIGIPVGIVASHRRVVTAFGISFAIVLFIFYPLLILGQLAAESGAFPIGPSMWAGNALTFLIGAVLTVKVMRG